MVFPLLLGRSRICDHTRTHEGAVSANKSLNTADKRRIESLVLVTVTPRIVSETRREHVPSIISSDEGAARYRSKLNA